MAFPLYMTRKTMLVGEKWGHFLTCDPYCPTAIQPLVASEYDIDAIVLCEIRIRIYGRLVSVAELSRFKTPHILQKEHGELKEQLATLQAECTELDKSERLLEEKKQECGVFVNQ